MDLHVLEVIQGSLVWWHDYSRSFLGDECFFGQHSAVGYSLDASFLVEFDVTSMLEHNIPVGEAGLPGHQRVFRHPPVAISPLESTFELGLALAHLL
jgi:hypothetical protein